MLLSRWMSGASCRLITCSVWNCSTLPAGDAAPVFTIPKMLRRALLFDRSLYGDLSRSAYAATRKFFEAHFLSLEKAVPAMVVAPQSFGSLLHLHPHLHSVLSLGVFTRDGVFHPAPEDIDFGPLEDLFRDEVFKTLLKKEKITEERVELQDVTVVEEEESQFVKLRRKNWARLIAKVWLEDPSLCVSCGEEMRVVSALTFLDLRGQSHFRFVGRTGYQSKSHHRGFL